LEIDLMLHTTQRTRRGTESVLLCGLLATFVAGFAACSGNSEPTPNAPSAASKPASEHPPTASAKPAANPTDAKLVNAPGETTKKTADAGATKSAAAPDSVAKAEPAVKLSEPQAATAAGAAATEKGKAAPDAAKPPTPAAAPAAVAKPANPANPEQEVDPNSKAKLTYEFNSDTKNFGKVMQGDVLNHTFVLTSSGEEDLVIKQAKPTCGCTVAQVAVQGADGKMAPYTFGGPIPPGRKIEISATLHTQNKRGHASSRINIFSNDPRGQSQLGLEAEVDPFFQVNPLSINFNTLSAKDTATDKASISTTRGEKVKLTAVKDNMPQGMKLDLKALDADADGKASKWELVATAGPGLVEGNLAYAVPLKSDLAIPGGEKLPNGASPTYEVSLTVMGRVTGMISFNPQFVSLGLIRPGQVISRSVRVTSHDAEFKLTEPKVSVQGRDSVDWEYAKYFKTVTRPAQGEKPGETAVDVELILNGMPDSLNGSFSGILVIQVGHPEKPEIKLPITGVCRGGPVAPAGDSGPK
jgi:hypothetical protein